MFLIEKLNILVKTQCDSIKKPLDLASLTARHKICLELLQTEKNYVNVLNTIIKVSFIISLFIVSTFAIVFRFSKSL